MSHQDDDANIGSDGEHADDSPEQSDHENSQIKDMLRQFLGDAVDSPEVDQMLSALGGAGMTGPGGNGAAGSMAMNNPAAFGMMQAQIQQMFSGDDSPVQASLATDVARRVAAENGDPATTASAARDGEQVAQVASLWLDAVTDIPALDGTARVASRAEWVELTMPMWVEVLTPLAEGVGGAVSGALTDRLGSDPDALNQALPENIPGLPPGMDLSGMMSQLTPMLRRVSASMFSMQLGQAAGALSKEVVSGTDVGLPLVPRESVVMVPENVRNFAEGLEIEPAEVMLYLTVRESARQRLYAGAPWLRAQVIDAVRAYASDLRLDTEGIEQKLSAVDPTDPEAMQQVLSEGLFHPQPSAAQRAALTRLETWLALVEGWVDIVTDRATRDHLPNHPALAETVRRRRATQGPAEKTFAGLMGLELRPRRLRDAANLFAAMEDSHGVTGRDGVWDHPDVAPDAQALDDPLGFVQAWGASSPVAGMDLDAELATLLGDSDAQPPSDSQGDAGHENRSAPGSGSSDGSGSGPQAGSDPEDGPDEASPPEAPPSGR